MGLFTGMSMISIIEVIYWAVKTMAKLINGGKRMRPAAGSTKII